MARASTYIAAMLLLISGCKTPDPVTTVKQSGISGVAPEDQRGTAFCWAYAIVAHLEQRYFEMTRGHDSGGFRLNFSEEYLGLVNLADQLLSGKPLQEGLLLSDSLKIVERYGIVPELVRDEDLFRAKFETSVAAAVNDLAQQYWQEKGLAEFTPMEPAVAFDILKQAAGLTEKKKLFLMAATGNGPDTDMRFQYFNGTYTPVTWAKNRLKFAAADYYVVQFPDSGRGQFNETDYTAEYRRAMQVVQKALLYGYSVPISFNLVRGMKAEAGVLGCQEEGCFDAEIAEPSPSWPHANHAVLLVDYLDVDRGLTPPTAASLQAAYEKVPRQWIIRNSWGFNNNTSAAPELLRRFPLPAYTVMTQDFFEASHKLVPGRYEALVPRKVCLKGVGSLECSPLVKLPATAESGAGLPGAGDLDLTIDPARILAARSAASFARDPVQYVAGAPMASGPAPLVRLVTPDPPAPDAPLTQVDLKSETRVEGVGDSRFTLCTKVQVQPAVKYVAMYVARPDQEAPPVTPSFILSQQNHWQHCSPVTNEPGMLRIHLQTINERFRVTSQIQALVTIP